MIIQGNLICFGRPFSSVTSRWQCTKVKHRWLRVQNMHMTSLTLCEWRGHRDLHSIQAAEVTAGVQSHNSSCVTCSTERKRASRVQICSYYPMLRSVTEKEKKTTTTAWLFHEYFKNNKLQYADFIGHLYFMWTTKLCFFCTHQSFHPY